MNHKIVFIPEAAKDYRELDSSVRRDVNRKIDELQKNPFLGHKLGKKFNIDLTGFFRLYVHGKKYRIVYRLTDENTIEIIEIWGIAKRENEEIYRIISSRLTKKGYRK